MYSVVVMCCALVAVASAGVVAPVAPAVAAPLLPRVQVAPAQVTVVRQPHVVQQPELRVRPVPVPVRAVAYTVPAVAYAAPVAAPALIAPSQVTFSAHGVPAIVNIH